MHICPCGIIGLVNAVLYRLNDNLAGMNANPDLQIRIVEACDPILHSKRREAAANSVILMRLGGAKQRHDAVALRFVDDAVITNNGFIHEVENWPQALHTRFGIAQAI